MAKLDLKKLRKVIDSANINFLIGSGMSRDFLDVLNNVETVLSDPSKSDIEKLEKKKEYFDKVMLWNLKIVDEIVDTSKDKTLLNYKNFYKIWNNILLHRENTILTKQISIFTTNIDIFSEKALEDTWIEFNDGFHGRFNPIFDISNFKKSYFKKSLHYENSSEVPVFNIMKIHGSLSRKRENDRVHLDKELSIVRNIEEKKSIDFENEYEKLMIVPPTKAKLEQTLLDDYYYDLLRIYSNELEKESSVLFVMWFSFADEHIRSLTCRVANSNPTLKIYIISRTTTIRSEYQELYNNAKNKNIDIITPEEDSEEYIFSHINSKIFEKIIESEELDNNHTLHVIEEDDPIAR